MVDSLGQDGRRDLGNAVRPPTSRLSAWHGGDSPSNTYCEGPECSLGPFPGSEILGFRLMIEG